MMEAIAMEYRNVLTTCVYCGCGCGLYFEVIDGEIVGVLPAKEHPISRGQLCIKGWNAASFVNHPDRLRTPLIRQGDRFKEATWDEALALVAEKLESIRDESGADSIGFLASAKCTNEENYLLQKLARAVIKTNNVDHCARL
jgi:predicted molibdopterin-dependent oxidoreductase YjgC